MKREKEELARRAGPTEGTLMNDSSSESAPGHGSAPAAPRWVKVSGVVALAVVVVFLVLHLTGSMGPGMHGGH
ncbi:hypothetical protein Sipo8835_40310 [Streptomyces ipomoeae]|uniref:Uncharacterized protein n=2 Tax=Streptomyces ipomoeae TaxID=103232 RepID=A0AAE8VUI0_9ACTN|nr:hypothetical protein [Streptomyces ipomoeae]MDX2695559.1 hypothetical protein [Streptomyces ipomoeae]MDX2842327.1 hypothetical protein [Streptomyces ipomoeae]TQE18606.1 hypothetical protein Sipo8835_40310 [Streptomyces ipomoeae]TQE30189.1 hypothetical protein Sipo7851_27740 [Streptomyces ipomoeae]